MKKPGLPGFFFMHRRVTVEKIKMHRRVPGNPLFELAWLAFPLVAALAFVAWVSREAAAANVLSFIEANRRKADVVYIGIVRDVQEQTRTRFSIQARAKLEVVYTARGPARAPRDAAIEFSTYDERTPALAGGPQYRLAVGDHVIVFAQAFRGGYPFFLLQGDRSGLRQSIEGLNERLRHMTRQQLEFEGITEADRKVQLDLYQALLAELK